MKENFTNNICYRDIPYEERVDTVIDWLSLPDGDRPDFLMLYFDEPDHTGHTVGPDGLEVRAVSQASALLLCLYF